MYLFKNYVKVLYFFDDVATINNLDKDEQFSKAMQIRLNEMHNDSEINKVFYDRPDSMYYVNSIDYLLDILFNSVDKLIKIKSKIEFVLTAQNVRMIYSICKAMQINCDCGQKLTCIFINIKNNKLSYHCKCDKCNTIWKMNLFKTGKTYQYEDFYKNKWEKIKI